MKHTLSRILLAGALALFAGSALAQSVNISATVKKSCTVVNNNPTLTITDYDPAAPSSAAGTLTITCTRGTLYSYLVGDGLHAVAPDRFLLGSAPTDVMKYTLGVDVGATGTYTNIPTGHVVAAGERSTGFGLPMTFGFQATIPAGEDGSSETLAYTDTVTLTISY